MGEIIFNVDNRIAEKWQLVSQNKRNKLSALISRALDLDEQFIPA